MWARFAAHCHRTGQVDHCLHVDGCRGSLAVSDDSSSRFPLVAVVLGGQDLLSGLPTCSTRLAVDCLYHSDSSEQRHL